jgi:hypothetical protein
MTKGSLLYLTQVEAQATGPGEPLQPTRTALLRAYIVLQAMFFDRLIVGDSQFINIPDLRSLIWPGEPSGNSQVLSDLAPLLDRQILVPALRSSTSSLTEVRNDLVRRGVYYAGSEEYVRFIEEHAGRSGQIRYEAATVSSFFRNQVLAILSSSNKKFRLKDSVRRSAYDYVANQDVLYHIRMRQWMLSELEHGRMTDFHRARLEEVLAAAYRHNVPMAIDRSLIDIPLDPRKFWTPIDIRLGNSSIIAGSAPADFAVFPLRPFSISPRMLGTLPVDVLLAIREDSTRNAALKRLDEFRRTGKIDAERLAGDIEDFFYSAEQIIYSAARGELRDHIRRGRRIRRNAILSVTRDLGLAVAGIGIWGTVDSVTSQVSNTSGYVGLAVTALASIQTLRDLGAAYQRGYAVGRTIPDDYRLVLARP